MILFLTKTYFIFFGLGFFFVAKFLSKLGNKIRIHFFELNYIEIKIAGIKKNFNIKIL